MPPRPELRNIPPDYHGALDYAELAKWGYAPEDVLDFSVNSNPFGTHPKVREAIANAAVDRYPDKDCLGLRDRLSEHLGVSAENIAIANGTAESIWQITFTYLRPNDLVLVVAPTFGEYARMSRLMGATVQSVTASELPTALNQSPRLVFLCTPNNPTGTITPTAQIHNWASNHPDTLFAIDEAYINFSSATSIIGHTPLPVTNLEKQAVGKRVSGIGFPETPAPQEWIPAYAGMTALVPDLFVNLQEAKGSGVRVPPNLLTLRSMTKDYALAGIRLGYTVAAKSIIDALHTVRVPWSVSEVAQQAGIVALSIHDEYAQQWCEINILAQQLKSDLTALGYPPDPSPMHYFLVNVGNGAAFRDQLLQHGIIVRKCDSFNLPNHVRIATRTAPENARLLSAIQELPTDPCGGQLATRAA